MGEVSTDLRVKGRDVAVAAVAALCIVAVASITVSAFVEPPATTVPRPVARVTTDDLEAMADMLAIVQESHDLTPAETRTVERLTEVVGAVETGEVEIVPAATPPAPPPTVTPTAPPTTTVPTTVPERVVHDWPTTTTAP